MKEPRNRSTGRRHPGPSRAIRPAVVALVLLSAPLAAWNAPAQSGWSLDVLAPQAEGIRERPVSTELSRPPADQTQPRIMLLVGTDSRALVPEPQRGRFGHLTGERADSVMLVELVPARQRIQILSLPRDLRVEIAGLGPVRLNSALTFGGPAGMVEAVRALTALPIHRYVELDFSAVALLVDALGGATLDFPRPARDLVTGFRAGRGTQRLDGAMAVAYARSRRYEEFHGGLWTPSDATDLGRIRRQQRLLLALRNEAPPRTASLLRVWFRLARHVTFDSRLSYGEAWRVLGDLTSWPVDERNVRTLPTRPTLDPAATISPFPPFHLGGVRAVQPVEPAASAVLEAFRRGDVLSPPPTSGQHDDLHA